MAETEAKITVNGDISPLRQKLREASNDLKQFGAEGESAFSRMTGPLGALQAKFVAIGAILAGGAVFKDAVAQTVLFTEESTKLGRAMGISASEASILREALIAGNTSQEEFIAASKGLAKQLINNEDGLNAMGLKTRDAAGQLRPLNDLVLDGIGVLNGYKAGTDRAIAGQTMFGKGFEMTGNLALMNKKAIAETTEQMRALGMVASVESVAAWEAFDAAGDKATLTLTGMKTTIGNSLMPVLTDLSNWFSQLGPEAIIVIRGAIGGLISAFHLLTTGVTVVWETINAFVYSVAEPLIGVSNAIVLAITGDFAGAERRLKGIFANIDNAWSGAMDRMTEKSQSTRDRIWNLFAEGTPTAAPGKGGNSADGLLKGDKDKAGKKDAVDPSFMQYYEAELALRKASFEQENALRQFSKDQELAYWRDIQQNAELTSKDRVTIAKRTATLELEIRRQSAKEQRELDSALVDSRRAGSLAQIQFEEQQAGFARENGAISKRQLLELEEQYARRRFEIEYQSLLERMELAKNDPNASPAELARIKEQMLEVERNYQMRRGELMQGKKKEEGSIGGFFDGVGNSFGQAVSAMLTRATTLRQALGGIFQGIYQSFVSNLISKPLGEWAAGLAKMLAVKLGFVAQEKAVDAATVLAAKVAKKAEGFTGVQANAAVAATGAAASQASIPIVGPMLALAAMASTFAQVSAFGNGMLAVAAKGYDVPKGLNPMTQLHEEEMVLPQKYANVIRGMAGGDSGSSVREGDISLHVHTQSTQDFARFLKTNSHALAPGLRQLARNFTPVKGR